MVRKHAAYTQAFELRKRGLSYTDVAKITGVAKSTVSLWFSSEKWSVEIAESNKKRAARENRKRISLLNKARTNQNTKIYTQSVKTAVTEYKYYKSSPLFIAGLIIFAAQGNTHHPSLIQVSSTRIEIHKIFVSFLIEFLGVPREKVRILPLLYPGSIPRETLEKWSGGIGIPLSQFYKYQVLQGKKNKNTLHLGVLNTIIGSAVLKKKLMKWLELNLQELT